MNYTQILEVTLPLFLRGPLNPSLRVPMGTDPQERDSSSELQRLRSKWHSSLPCQGGPEPSPVPHTRCHLLTGVVKGNLPAAGGGPGAVVHRSSFHDVRLRGVGFRSSHQDTDPVKHTGESPGRRGRSGPTGGGPGTAGQGLSSRERRAGRRRLPTAFPEVSLKLVGARSPGPAGRAARGCSLGHGRTHRPPGAALRERPARPARGGTHVLGSGM